METTFDNNPNLLNPQSLQEKIQGLKISFEVYHALEQLWLELNEKEILTPNESDFIQKLSQFQDKLVSSFVHLNNSYETFKELLRKHDMQ
ncbi:hypothetical protein [Paenibacillus elgii]|uniref:hypothetical protein n=1 Tax=Paenibacillus elgii TaxID=189691 RepID=UPI0002F3B11E|nr:hypothetical protein [Paenibacillus elgii]